MANEAAREMRSQQVAKANIVFWAKEILLESLEKRIQQQAEHKRWAKQAVRDILVKVSEVAMVRILLINIARNSVEVSEKNQRDKVVVEVVGLKLGGRTPTKEDKKDEDKDKNTWKKVWEQVNQRRIVIPKKRVRLRKKDKENEDKTTGGCLREWMETTSSPQNGTKVLELKKKLNLISPVPENRNEDQDESYRKRKFGEAKSVFEPEKKTARSATKKRRMTPVRPPDPVTVERMVEKNRQTDVHFDSKKFSNSSTSHCGKGTKKSGGVGNGSEKDGIEKERGTGSLGGKTGQGVQKDGGGGRMKLKPTWLQPRLKFKGIEVINSPNLDIWKDHESPIEILPDKTAELSN